MERNGAKQCVKGLKSLNAQRLTPTPLPSSKLVVMSPRLAFALDAAFRAGRLTLKYFQTGTSVEWKADQTPVTAADREAEALIRHAIEKAYPGEAILGEEEGLEGKGEDRWVIDPIDGTKSFMCGVPLYATLLSYERAGDTVLAVCYFPALDEMLYAERGSGAFWNGRTAHVSEFESLDRSRIVCGSMNTFRLQGRLDGLLVLGDRGLTLRTWCDAYGHALVATGRAEAMVDPAVNAWDISSMSLLVREAGGRFTDFKGDEVPLNEAISSNGVIHDQVLEVFRP